ncbi:PTTG1IP family member 2 isoform X2 [Tamandua tetradactyla]|uniref:PTTG1IP family member 2 isoform X2 n=1 Tax=Tamandua tetradactyla TaxID=48850 RepID=UPI0040543DD1
MSEIHLTQKECAEKKKCNSCIEDRGCFWCSGENTCKTFCFRSRCQLSSLFWLNCRVDMFGVLMLLLIAVLVIAFICYCLIFSCYMHEIAGRPEGTYIHHWNRSVYDG